jgi:hypothetical protein
VVEAPLRIIEEINHLVRRICSRATVVDDVLDRADAAKRHRNQIVELDAWGVRYFERVGVYSRKSGPFYRKRPEGS